MSTHGNSEEGVEVGIDQLRVGVYISLAEHWLDHPFLFNEFRISNEKQLRTLQAMGLAKIRCIPSRSTQPPLPAAPLAAAPPVAPVTVSAEDIAAMEAKRQRIQRVADTREQLNRCEKAYSRTAGAVRKLMQDLHAAPARAVQAAHELIQETVDDFIHHHEIALLLIGQKQRDENAYFHALNVTILSLMLAQAEGFDEHALLNLGMGALFHDLGKARIPDALLRKGAQRSRVEEEFYRLHGQYGVQMAREIGGFEAASIDIILHHHERLDGSGFPDRLGANLGAEARIVGLCNRYDELCNSPGASLTPADALAQMFSRERKWWDERLLARFIKQLGVYPPGSIVMLSNGVQGIVVGVNRDDPLRPSVMLYDRSIPRQEAMIIDLIDAPEVKIEHTLKREQLDPEVLDYLAPRRQLSYFYGKNAEH